MKNLCWIVGAGSFEGAAINRMPGDCIIAADGGYGAVKSIGLQPNLAVGDFDSLGFVPDDTEVLRHPPEKDDTDMFLAIEQGLKRGFRDFLILGGLGGRLDHSLSNINCLSYISKLGARAWLWGEGTAITAVTNDTIEFPENCSGMFSIFAHGGDCTGVCEKGSKYLLDNAFLSADSTLGTSNEFTGNKTEVGVQSGTLTVLFSCTCGELEKMIRDGYC